MSRRLSRQSLVVIGAVVMIVTALSGGAAAAGDGTLVTASENSSATELGNGTLSNAQVERSGEPGVVSHDVNRSSAVARYAMDYGSGSTAYDHVGSSDGSFQGDPAWVTGVSDQALSLDGSDYVKVPKNKFDGLNGSDVTLSIWAKTNSSSTQRLVSIEGAWWLSTSPDGNGTAGGTFDGDSNANLRSNTVVTDGEWHHIVLTHEGGTTRLYVDGTLEDEVNQTQFDITTLDRANGLGARYQGSFKTNGVIDEARVYGEALSPDLVTRLAEYPNGKLSQSAINGEDGWYRAEHVASGDLQAYADLELRNETSTVTIESWDGASWSTITTKTYTTSGNKTFNFSAPGANKVRTNVTFSNTSADHLGRLHAEGIQFTNGAPAVDNTSASPTGDLQQNQVTFEINVSDPQLGTAQGDELTVDWYIDGAKDASTTVTSNGTASYSTSGLNGGDHTWHVVVTDEHGATVTSQTFSISVPSKLAIRNESNPNQLVTGAELELTFYYSDQVIVKEDTDGDGYINMTGLPVDQKFVVVATADGYLNRHIIVDSIYHQSSIYLIPNNATAVEVRFNINDPTGRFTSGDSEVVIQRAITRDFDGDGTNETQFVNVAADEAGVAGFSTFLVQDARYRLKVRNQKGDVRILGAYTATASEEVTLKPVPLGIDTGGETAYNYTAWQQNVSGNERITFEFADNANATTDMTVSIWEQGNQSHQPDGWDDTTVDGPLGSTKIVHPLDPSDADTTWVVKFEASRDGKAISGEVIVGPNIRNPLTGDAPAWLLQATALVVIVMTGALFSKLNTGVGAVTTSFVAGGFWWAGFLPPEAGGAVVIVLVVSVLYKTQGDR